MRPPFERPIETSAPRNSDSYLRCSADILSEAVTTISSTQPQVFYITKHTWGVGRHSHPHVVSMAIGTRVNASPCNNLC
jgi:hypothetical protein